MGGVVVCMWLCVCGCMYHHHTNNIHTGIYEFVSPDGDPVSTTTPVSMPTSPTYSESSPSSTTTMLSSPTDQVTSPMDPVTSPTDQETSSPPVTDQSTPEPGGLGT